MIGGEGSNAALVMMIRGSRYVWIEGLNTVIGICLRWFFYERSWFTDNSLVVKMRKSVKKKMVHIGRLLLALITYNTAAIAAFPTHPNYFANLLAPNVPLEDL